MVIQHPSISETLFFFFFFLNLYTRFKPERGLIVFCLEATILGYIPSKRQRLGWKFSDNTDMTLGHEILKQCSWSPEDLIRQSPKNPNEKKSECCYGSQWGYLCSGRHRIEGKYLEETAFRVTIRYGQVFFVWIVMFSQECKRQNELRIIEIL